MSASDDIVDGVIQRQLEVNRYVGSITQRLNAVLSDLALDIEDAFRGDIRDYTKAELGKLLADVKATVTETFNLFFADLLREWEELAQDEAERVVEDNNTILGILFFTTVLSQAQTDKIIRNLTIESMPFAELQKRMIGDAYFRINQAIRQGIDAKETNGQIIKRVYDQTGRGRSAITTTAQTVGGVIATAIAEIIGAVQFATYEAHEKKIAFVQHISVLDNKTSDTCIARAGKVWTYPGYEPQGHNLPFARPPLHYRCRSRVTFIPAFDKTPAKDLTFDEFLKTKSTSYQDETLGKGRADLWRKGDITLTQLIDQSNNPLTLKELRALRS